MSSPKLLIVEDDPKSRYALQSVLQDRGFDVVACESAESMDGHANNSFDAAIIDVRLTGASGPELARRLQKSHPNLRIVFVTAYNGVEPIEAEFPGCKVLVKPLDMDRLLSLL